MLRNWQTKCDPQRENPRRGDGNRRLNGCDLTGAIEPDQLPSRSSAAPPGDRPGRGDREDAGLTSCSVQIFG